jgi:YD repeat-containing protein
VQATAPVPDTYGQPFAWQGSLPVPYGVLNLWNGNLMVGLGLFGWGGQTGVAFGLTYNAQDREEGVLGVGWRHSYEASLVVRQRNGQLLVELREPDGRRLEFAEQPDESYVGMRGVYSQLRLVGGRYELVRPSQEKWLFEPVSWARSPSGATSHFCWDERGNLTRVEDPTGNWVELEWNALNRISKVRDSLTPAGMYRLQYEHNAMGDLEQVIELAGWGNAITTATTQYEWDTVRGLLREAWDAEGHRVQKRLYDDWGYLRQVQDALERGGEVLARNALGWVEKVRNARGQVIKYRYDSWGRLRKKEVYRDAQEQELLSWVEYRYADAEGRLERVEESSGRVTEYAYQAGTGFLQSVSTPEGVVEYEWPLGLLHKVRVKPAGTTAQQWQEWRYEYNNADELWKVYRVNSPTGAEVLEVEYHRDSYGRLQRVEYYRDGPAVATEVEYTYDSADRVWQEEYRAGSTPYRRVRYTRDGLGRIWQKEESIWSNGWQRQATTTYTYDHQGQLVREVRTGQNAYTIEYGCDLVGNRLTRTRTVNGQTFTDGMEYNEANQLVSLNSREQEWEYDLDGNVVVRRANGEAWLLDYDAEGNLVSLQRQGDAVGWVYEYDGLGRRVRAVRGSLVVEYLYSGDTVVAERANGGEWVYYGYGGAMYSQVAGGQVEYKHWSVRGDLVATSSPGGAFLPAPFTDAFGGTVNNDTRQTYDWNGAWGYRKELVEAEL